jgi:ribosomal protein S18 acetylase RimI-like enzyme
MTLTIATKAQLPIIRDLAYKIWPDTYGATHTTAELDYMLSKFYSVASLEQQMEKGHVFVLVEENDVFLGFVSYELFSEDTNFTKIHKLYVLPQTQGKGIGKALVDYVKNEAIINKNDALFLNVNKLNKAKDFYHRYGFTITKEIVIDIGEGFVMDDFVMELTV